MERISINKGFIFPLELAIFTYRSVFYIQQYNPISRGFEE
jgi:hypothetical protein